MGKARGHSQLCRWVRRNSVQIGVIECYSSAEPLKIAFRTEAVVFIHSLQNILEGFYCSSTTWAVSGTNCFVEGCCPGARVDCAQAPGPMPFSAQRHSQQRSSVAPTAWAGLWIQNSPTTGFLKIGLFFEVSRKSTDFSVFQKLLAKY